MLHRLTFCPFLLHSSSPNSDSNPVMNVRKYLALINCVALTVLTATSFSADPVLSDRFKPAEPSTSQELFGQTIRASAHRTPAEELAGFHVPDGFQVELVAAEPTIAKPMNMAFDTKGRLWITQSTQYPFPAKANEVGKDAVIVFEDREQDGKFETSRIFADGLNIPIGLLPYGDGVLCFSIPNILYLRDTDQDGVCDKREILLGPFDTTRDTHGMINSLRMGMDGWVYACHGFNNQSKVQGKDGHAISMTSGNVFRFKPDGSRVELFSQGQVNPFGMAQDRWGFWYAADCHSKPISQLIRGGCYPSFGRPDDGLGFVPPMMNHLHGSTAISGLAHSKDSRFPKEFEDNFFSGNVMTCRVNRNHVVYQGATAKAVAMPDLLTSDDPWFRPVDLQFGPDGCLYIADFYNKVIGHYEVPLDHPDRDSTSGRIWRVRWKGDGEEILVPTKLLQNGELLKSQISQNGSTDLNPALSKEVESLSLNKIPDAVRAQSFFDLMGAKGVEREANWLLNQTLRVSSTSDPVLSQSLLIAIRAIATRIRDSEPARFNRWVPDVCNDVSTSSDSPKMRALTRVLLALKDPSSVAGILSLCEKQVSMIEYSGDQRLVLDQTIVSIADVVDESNMDRFLALLDSTNKEADARADQLLQIARRQMQQRGKVLGSLVLRCQDMVGELATKWLDESATREPGELRLISWSGKSAKNDDRKEWLPESRELTRNPDALGKRATFFSSFPLGESYTGTWSSSPFIAPSQLEFYVVGHNGLPGKEAVSKNYVSLVRLDNAGNVAEELFRALPPQRDLGKLVRWDLQKHEGAAVQLRVVDGDSAASYAWIGVGENSLVGLNPGPIRDKWERIVSAVTLCGFPSKPESLEKLTRLLSSEETDWTSRFRLHCLSDKNVHTEVVELTSFAVEQNWTDLFALIGVETGTVPNWDWSSFDQEGLLKFGEAICKRCSYLEQERLLLRLSKHRAAISYIASLCERGSLSRDALRILPKSWWESLPQESFARVEALRPEPTPSSNRLKVVESKATSLESIKPDMQVGAKQFADRCALCHKLGEQGKVVGPQLEGAGARGILRLCEDILWPDRNVDEAFKMTMMVLDGGESLSGLVSDRTSESLLLTDQTGNQRRILLSDIEQEKASKLSLMPGNFDELMTDAELASLIGYLRNASNVK